jgi:hypothetical protein
LGVPDPTIRGGGWRRSSLGESAQTAFNLILEVVMKRMMAVLCAMALLLPACGGDATEPPPPSLAGVWEGQCDCPPYAGPMALTLDHNTSSGSLAGNGAWGGAWGQLSLTITGVVVLPNVSLTLAASAGPFSAGKLTCSGTVTSKIMSCTLVGPGFSPVLIRFSRR